MVRGKSIAIFEIVLLIGMSFSFAYILGETNDLFQGVRHESKFVKLSRIIILSSLSKGLVSAQQLVTCPENLNGTICQQYSSDICEDNCVVGCLPTDPENLDICTSGLCYDGTTGSCQPNTPHLACTNAGGIWYNPDDEGYPPGVCEPICCLSYPPENTQAQYITQQQCEYYSSSTGIPVEWQSVPNELECLLMATTQNEGACVLNPDPGETLNNCQFVTETECTSIGGDFYEGSLCTNNPDLNTICTLTEETACKEGEDKVYYIDSCGNFANVYDSTENADYWKVIASPDELCELAQGSDPFGNQNSCGNCEYLLGSACGTPQDGVDETPDDGSYVCRNLNCVADEWGNERKHGESWCAFDGKIGVVNDGSANSERSVGVPGSRHYKKTCYEGEIRTEACADYRNEICSESVDEINDFSQAACRINGWQTCIASNLADTELNECETYTDCTLRRTDIEDYEFDFCVPKHPPGFDLGSETGGNIGEGLCASASQKCTYIEVKKLHSGGWLSGDWFTWECEVNCACKGSAFTKSMNNFCMSLGDCGGQVNVEGEYTSNGYSVSGAPGLSSSYVNSLSNYADDVNGQFIDSLSNGELAALFGIDESVFENEAEYAEMLGMFGAGAMAYWAFASYEAGSFLQGVCTGGCGTQVMGGFGTAMAGAAAGAAIGYLLGHLLGEDAETIQTMMIVGAVVMGILIWLNPAWLNPWMFWVALAAFLLQMFAGLGETREKTVSFSCMPWQPPTGGADCDKCDDDPERPCSKYKCESLGQTCEFINEGTEDALCYNVSPDDSSAPVIDVWEEEIGEDFEYVDAQQNVGTKIESISSDDGCIQEFTPVEFGIEINEPAQCKISTDPSENYEDMSGYFSEGNLYKYNHQRIQLMPTLASLGVPGVGPDRRGELDLYIKCKDGSGNANINAYAVQFCVSPTDDMTAPIINKFVPESPGYVAFGINEMALQLFTNEPADCKWDSTDIDYFSMSSNMTCLNQIEDWTIDGWPCSTILDVPEGDDEEIDYYFRCLDQPWLSWDNETENDGDRIANAEGINYQVIRTTEELVIDVVNPVDGETFYSGGVPFIVDVEIHTSGGVDGTADCEYSFGNTGIYYHFSPPGVNIHNQLFNALPAGEHSLQFRCTDEAGNLATNSTSFTTEVDSTGPVTTRVYDSGGTLTVITNEPAECAYDNDSCTFEFEDENMMSGSGLVHTLPFETGLEYYIKCKDIYETMGECLVVTGGY